MISRCTINADVQKFIINNILPSNIIYSMQRLKLIEGSQKGDINTVKMALNCGIDINFIHFVSKCHY